MVPVGFICSVITYHLSACLKARFRVLRPGEEPSLGGTWARYFEYLGKTLGVANDCLREEGPWAPLDAGYGLILDMFFSDIELHESLWQGHANGFFAYVKHRGGIHTVLGSGQRGFTRSYRALNILMHAVGANTTSPAKQQIFGFDSYSDDDIRTIHSDHVPEDMPCPTELFLAIIHITRHRVLAIPWTAKEKKRRLPPLTPPALETIYEKISAFDVKA
ncbi:hypothetical protein LLEC1_07601 [Akanthomyces lecanii]|uniref:Uncharacterized protein n=1 Tax=Cordyceps confragosa TaxID=2714763 RepID=A0A179I4R3_CORDF|nr:hypothetical protein LLEC1_07601 [Akanthomyces lecanii]